MAIKSTGDETNVKNNDGEFDLPNHNLDTLTSLNSSEDILKYARENREKVLERKKEKLEKERDSLSKEQLEINKELNKLNSAEKLAQKLALVDEKTKEIVFDSLPKTGEIGNFLGFVKYNYKDDPIEITTNGKTEVIINEVTRSFTPNFQKYSQLENQVIYAVKIGNKWFLKDDILSLYFAFQEEISKSFKFWIEDYKETARKIKEEKEANKEQLNLFADDFHYSGVKDTIIRLKIHSNYENKWIDFEFPIAFGKFFGLKLNKNDILQSQDIYYIYHHFETIIKQFLNK